jgi:hypothetical protein
VASDVRAGGAPSDLTGAAGAHSLESSSLDTPVLGAPELRVLLLPGHTRQRGLLNVTVTRYPDGLSACVWQSQDPVFNRKDRQPGKRKEDSERWESAKVRAKARVRHLARCLGIDHLWTFTKRGKFESLDCLWSAWKEFNRLMDKRYGDKWYYVAVPELHSDGETWHLHVGLHGFWDVKLLRSYWHRALGVKWLARGADSPGNVDAKRFRGKSVRSIAGYITKYIGKGFDRVSVGRRLFSSTVGIRPLERRELHFPVELGDNELYEQMCLYLHSLCGIRWWDARVYGDGVRACVVFEAPS